MLDGMAEAGNITADEAEKAEKHAAEVPEDQGRAAPTAASVATCSRWSATSCAGLGYTDEEIDGGGLQVTTTFTQKAMDAAEDGRRGSGPRASATSSCTSPSPASSPAPARCAASTAARTTWSPRSTGPSPAAWPARRSSRSPWPPRSRTATRSRTPSTATRPTSSPTAVDGRNEGGGDGNDYGSAVSLSTATEESINTAFVDMTDLDGPTARRRSSRPPRDRASRRPRRRKKYPGIPDTSPDLEPDALDHARQGPVSPINMANAYATIANGGERADVHVIEKVVERRRRDALQRTRSRSTDRAIARGHRRRHVATPCSRWSSTAPARRAQALGRPAAGKTGTATNDKDEVSSSWFVGYTPQLSTAVMYVRGDGDDQLDGLAAVVLRRPTTRPAPGPR